MYSRIKSTLLNHFHKPSYDLSKEEKKRMRHSLAECQLTDSAYRWSDYGHAPLAPAEEDDEGEHLTANNYNNQTLFSQLSNNTSVGSNNHNSSRNCNSVFIERTERFAAEEEQEYGDYDDPQDPIMPHFALSWNVQYLGSFPCSNVTPEYIGPRLEKFKSVSSPQNVELSVSLLGVRVCCEQTVILSHSLRRISSVVGRPISKQVAYIALEPAGRTYRRLCHVFQAQDTFQIEEIENVLGQAFDAQLLTRAAKPTSSSSTTAIQNPTTVDSEAATVPPMASMIGGTMNEKRSASTVFLNKFLGKKGSQTIDDVACKRKRRPVSAVFSSAIHRFSSSTSSVTPKRMTTTELTLSAAKREKEQNSHHQQQQQLRLASPVPEEPTPRRAVTISSLRASGSGSSSDIENQKMSSSASTSSAASGSASGSTSASPPPSSTLSLIYDEQLGEWIYPIDASTTAQLENCNYFVGLPSREALVRNLLSAPEGAFVIRYSESKTQCLVMSMRVPPTHNMSGVSHYLIIRNNDGYRLKLSGSKKPFASLQMLLTHHSVLEGHLPCTLNFFQWDKSAWKQQSTLERTAIRHQKRHSTTLSKIDENRNMMTPTPLGSSNLNLNMNLPPSSTRRCGVEDFSTPKRRSRHDINAVRRSQFFEIEDRRIVL